MFLHYIFNKNTKQKHKTNGILRLPENKLMHYLFKILAIYI